jgi:TonB family protein
VNGTAELKPGAPGFVYPVPVHRVEPEYSDEARKARFQGIVVLRVEIDASGRTRRAEVVRPLGLGLDEQALAAAARWRFRPALSGGRPVACTITIEFNFRLL